MAKQLLYGVAARERLMAGMQTLAKAVKATIGPRGRNVIVEKFSKPVSTKDGVTVAKEIELRDPFENMGAKILGEVASRTHDQVGDGTTTAVVLADRMIDAGRRFLASGVRPIDLRRGIERAVDKAVEAIRKIAVAVKDYKEIQQVATMASNWDEAIGKLVADAMEKVGKDGVITIEESKGMSTYLDVVEGMQFDRGYISPYFVTDLKTLQAEYEDPYFLFHEKKLNSLRDAIPLLEKVAATGKPLVIVAEDVEGDLLAALVINKLQNALKVVAVKAPGFGDRRKNLLEDMAILTGGRLISEDLGVALENVEISDLGRAKKVVVEKEKTTIIEGAAKKGAVKERIRQLDMQMEQTTSTYDKEKLMERKAKLSGGVGILYIGGATEADMKERKERATGALHATKAAVEEGIVPGGGVAFVRAIPDLEDMRAKGDEQFGIDVVKEALKEPLRKIAENAGMDGGEVVAEVMSRKGSIGFDANTRTYTDMFEAGIVDPAKVAITALWNAASAAALQLTSDVLVTELKKKTPPSSGAVT